MISFSRNSDYIKSPPDVPVCNLDPTTPTYDRVSTFHFEFSITTPVFEGPHKIVNPPT